MCPKYKKPKSRVKKPRGSDIEWSNPYGNQVTHFVGCTKNHDAENSSCNHKKVGITSDIGPIICVSFINKKKHK